MPRPGRAPRSGDGREMYRDRRPISTESPLSITKQALGEPAFWPLSVGVLDSNHTFGRNHAIPGSSPLSPRHASSRGTPQRQLGEKR